MTDRRDVLPDEAVPDRLHVIDGRQSSAWWGALFAVLVVGAVLGYLTYAYFYLYVTAAEWPPGGLSAPDLLHAAVGAAVALAAALPLVAVHAAEDRRDPFLVRRGSLAVAGAGVAVLAVMGWVALGLDVAEPLDAYSSIVLVLLAYMALVTAVGIVMALVVVYQATLAESMAWVWSAATVLEVWWGFTALGWLGVLGVTHVWPQLV
jgi:hypothetical protein